MRRLNSIALLLLAILCAPAQAASLSLVYLGDNLVAPGVIGAPVGSTVDFEIVMDFRDTPTLGGGFDVVFDSERLLFNGFENFDLGNPDFSRDPDVLDGLLESWAFGSFSPIFGPAVVGRVSFTVLSNAGSGAAFVSVGPTFGPGGPFICNLGDCISVPDVEYNSFLIAPVPLPAAGWLLLSALVVLFRTPTDLARKTR